MYSNRSSFFRPEIQGLRGIAVLLVLIYHLDIPLFKGGFIGVDIFFVISGYIITKIILNEIENNTFSLKKFYERRIRRILPAYLIVSSSTLIVSYFVLMPSKLIDFAKSLISTLFFVSNIFFTYSYNYFFEGSETSLLHTWSLSVEEQFYIFYPLFFLFFLVFAKKNYLKFMTPTLILIGIFSFSLSNYLVFNGYNSIAFYNLHTRSWQLILGALTFIFEKKYNYENSRGNVIFSELTLFVAILIIFFSAIFMNKNVLHPSYITLIPVFALSLMIYCSNYSKFFIKILKNKFLSFIGNISYSLYLWHFVIIYYVNEIFINESKVFNVFFSIFLSFLSATLTYKYIENPIRDKKKVNFKKVIIFIIAFYSFLISSSFLIYHKNGFSHKSLVKNIQKDNEILFREFRESIANDKSSLFKNDKTKLIVVGNSYGRGFYNFIKLNNNLYKNIDIRMFDIKNVDCLLNTILTKEIVDACNNSKEYQLKNIDYKNNILNFLNSEIVFFVSTWEKNEIENLNNISKLKSIYPEKEFIIVSKQPEFLFKKPLKNIWLYTEIDLYLDEKGEKIIENSNDEYLKNFFDKKYFDLIDNDVRNVNKALFSFTKDNKIQYFDVFSLICDQDKKKCHSLTDNGEKVFFDNGHISVSGSIFFGKIFQNEINKITLKQKND